MLGADPSLIDSRKYVEPAREAVAQEAARLLGVLGTPAAVPGQYATQAPARG